MVLRNSGVVARFQGEYLRATALFHERVAEADTGPLRDGWAITRGLCNLARVAYLQGDPEFARTLVSQSLEVTQESHFAGAALADALEVLALAEVAEGKAIRAATLFGAAEVQWRASGGSRYPPDQPDYDRGMTSVRGSRDDHTYTLAWSEGQAVSADRAMEYART